MQQGLLHLHNIMRWAVLIFGIWTIFQSLGNTNSGKTFTAKNKRIALFFLISCDIQLLLGLALWFMGPWGIKNIQNVGMAEVMKDTAGRFFAVEHGLMMLIAIILVHIGYSATKKGEDSKKFKKLFWYSTIAIVIMLISIPWPFREAVGRAFFPGM